jgi:hypothetical protein
MLSTGDSNLIFHSDIVLGAGQPSRIAVELEGWYDTLEPITRSYSGNASRTYFPYPKALSPTAASRGRAMMVMTFDRAGLARAAASATRRSAR